MKQPMPAAPGQGRQAESFQRSLRYFNLYRLVVAALFLTAVLGYDLVPAVGAVSPERFTRICAAYLLLAVIIFALPERKQFRFNWILTAGVMVDIISFTMMMHQSGGVRSGFAYMLLVALAGAGIVGQGRMTLFHAAMATLAVLIEQSWRVLTEVGEAAGVLPGWRHEPGIFRHCHYRPPTGESRDSQRGTGTPTGRGTGGPVAYQPACDPRHAGRRAGGRQGRQCAPAQPAGGGACSEWQGQDLTRLAQFSSALQERFSIWYGAARECSELLRTAEGQRLLRVRFLPPGERGNPLLYIEDMALVQAQAQQIKLAALGRLAANMAHEIRNPLASISHAAELLAEEHADPTHARLTRIIGDNTQRLDRIVNEVLELGRRDRAAPEVIRVNEFCGGWSRSWR